MVAAGQHSWIQLSTRAYIILRIGRAIKLGLTVALLAIVDQRNRARSRTRAPGASDLARTAPPIVGKQLKLIIIRSHEQSVSTRSRLLCLLTYYRCRPGRRT